MNQLVYVQPDIANGIIMKEGSILKRRQRSSLLFGGQNLFTALALLHQDDMKKRMNCTRIIWRNGWIAPGWYEETDELHQDDMKKTDEFILFVVLVQNSQRGDELNTFCPPNSSDDLCLLFCLNPSSMLIWRDAGIRIRVAARCSSMKIRQGKDHKIVLKIWDAGHKFYCKMLHNTWGRYLILCKYHLRY